MDKALSMFAGYVIVGALTGMVLGNGRAQRRIRALRDQLAQREASASPKPKPGLLIEGEFVRVN